MKAVHLAWVAICCILGPASISPSAAQTADWFSFEVCNTSGIRNVSVALTSKNDINGANWHVIGWYVIPDGGCYNIGGFWRDRIYVFAQGDGGAYWGGSDTTQCVNLTQKFEQVFSSNYECRAGETAVGMSAVVVPANTGTYTMNLQ
jgi:uncharacterized membrane protein